MYRYYSDTFIEIQRPLKFSARYLLFMISYLRPLEMYNWLQEKPDEQGQGMWEGKQKGKSDKRITESKARQKESTTLCTNPWKCPFNILKEKQWKPLSKSKKRGENLSPRHMKACHNVSTALLQSVAEIGTQSTTKSSKKTLHDFSSYILQNTPKMTRSSSTNEMLHTDITVRAQRARVSITYAMEATNSHKPDHAINKLSRHRPQPAPILHSEEIVVMDRQDRRRAKQSKSAEARIKFVMLSSQYKVAMEWETSTYTMNIGVRASTCNRHINNKMTVWSHKV
jgi:hypothetical protein